jgi:hypothetical protein
MAEEFRSEVIELVLTGSPNWIRPLYEFWRTLELDDRPQFFERLEYIEYLNGDTFSTIECAQFCWRVWASERLWESDAKWLGGCSSLLSHRNEYLRRLGSEGVRSRREESMPVPGRARNGDANWTELKLPVER